MNEKNQTDNFLIEMRAMCLENIFTINNLKNIVIVESIIWYIVKIINGINKS